MCGDCFIQHWLNNYLRYKETEEPITIVWDIQWACEGPFKVTEIEAAKLSSTG